MKKKEHEALTETLENLDCLISLYNEDELSDGQANGACMVYHLLKIIDAFVLAKEAREVFDILKEIVQIAEDEEESEGPINEEGKFSERYDKLWERVEAMKKRLAL